MYHVLETKTPETDDGAYSATENATVVAYEDLHPMDIQELPTLYTDLTSESGDQRIEYEVVASQEI